MTSTRQRAALQSQIWKIALRAQIDVIVADLETV